MKTSNERPKKRQRACTSVTSLPPPSSLPPHPHVLTPSQSAPLPALKHATPSRACTMKHRVGLAASRWVRPYTGAHNRLGRAQPAQANDRSAHTHTRALLTTKLGEKTPSTSRPSTEAHPVNPDEFLYKFRFFFGCTARRLDSENKFR